MTSKCIASLPISFTADPSYRRVDRPLGVRKLNDDAFTARRRSRDPERDSVVGFLSVCPSVRHTPVYTTLPV